MHIIQKFMSPCARRRSKEIRCLHQKGRLHMSQHSVDLRQSRMQVSQKSPGSWQEYIGLHQGIKGVHRKEQQALVNLKKI